MGTIVGFTVLFGLSEKDLKCAIMTQHRALDHFKHLDHQSIEVGESRLEIWGHKDLMDRVQLLPDGAVLVLIGSPHPEVCWPRVQEDLAKVVRPADFETPWDGRFILLKISADGQHWTMWNDWIGSIPVFHTQINQGRIASTLEPVVVATARYTPDDIFLPGLTSLLINGHFLADWTLFKDMKVMLPDCVAEWNSQGFHSKHLWTVEPSDKHWETGWDDLVDEMYELSREAISSVLKTQPAWILPLSAGLDSRLIAGVAAELGSDIYTYSWGSPETTDIIYGRQIAAVLGFPWKRVDLGTDYLANYTKMWAEWFGSSLHFHGMYQLEFMDFLKYAPPGPVISGFLGESLAGGHLNPLATLDYNQNRYQILPDGWTHWSIEEIKSLLKVSVSEVLEPIAEELSRQIDVVPGARFQRLMFLDFWNRQRLFIFFQSALADYWRGVATPYLNRDYARFCLSLPRTTLDDRRLLKDVFRRYYGPLAVIPGTYGSKPLIPTGSYLLKRRISGLLPASLRYGPLRGFDYVRLTMDAECVSATGQSSLWPIFEAWEELAEWLDISMVTETYDNAMATRKEMKPIRKLQSVQTLAYRLLSAQNSI